MQPTIAPEDIVDVDLTVVNNTVQISSINVSSTELVSETFLAGPAGPANTLAIGSVTTGAAGELASASITGEVPNQFLNLKIPAGTSGQGQKPATITVGRTIGQNADYICDGTADNVELQQAVDALIALGGGTLEVFRGTYDIQTRVKILGSNITVRGHGRGATTFRLGNNANQEIWIVGNGNIGDSGAGDGPSVIICNDVSFYDFTLDGNKANQATAAQFPSIRYGGSATRNLLRYRSDAQSSYGGTVQNVHAINGIQNGLSCESHALGAFIDCFVENCDQNGIWVENTSNWNLAQLYTRNNGQDITIGGSGVRVLSSGGVQLVGLDSKGDRGSALTFLHVGDSSFTGVSAYRTGWQNSSADNAASGIAMSDVTNVTGGNVNIYGSQGHGFELNGVRKSNFNNFTFRRNGQKANNTYSDMWITFAGGSSVVNNNFSNFTFNNENPTFYTNKAQYNIGANAPTAHTGNKFSGMNFGAPVTASLYQITFGNSFFDTPGVNPIGSFNYGYLDPGQVIDPAAGSFLIGTGFTSDTSISITDGKYVGQEFTFKFSQDVGNKQLTWPANVKWSNGKPIFSGVPNSDDLMHFVWDGTNWYGTHNEYDRTYKSFAYFDANATIDPSTDGSVLDGTGFTSNTNMTITNGRTKGQKFILIFRQDNNANQKSITFGSNVEWSGGIAPVFASGANLFNVFYFTWNGSKWHGFSGGGGFTQTQADARYLQLTGGTLSGGLNVNTPSNYAPVTMLGQNGKLVAQAGGQGDNNNYISSGNAAGTANLPLNITGYNNNVGSTLNLKFSNVNLSGKLTNVTDPTDPQDGATKSYVDNRDSLKYDKTGGTLSGSIIVAKPSDYAGTTLTGQNAQLNLLAGGLGDNQNYIQSSNAANNANLPLNITGYSNNIGSTLNLKFSNVNMSGKITNLTDPIDPQDGATKNYVDTIAQGLSVKGSVVYATAAPLATNTYSANVITASANGALTVDGNSPALNDRILVKDEASALKNGIYRVTAVGSGAAPFTLTRSADMDTGAEVPGAFTFVEAGTVNQSAGYVVGGYGPFTLGTTAINWTKFSQVASSTGVQTVTAGDGTITIAGSTANPTVAVSSSFQSANATALAGRKTVMTQQPTQTASFSAVASNFYPVNASAGNVIVTLPTSVAGQEIQIKKLDANAASGATSGIVQVTGTINGVSSATVPLRKQGMGKQYLADGSGGWTVVLGDLDITQLGASTTEQGFVQLAGDLAGTNTAPTVPGLALKVNKAGDTMTGTLTTQNLLPATTATYGLGSSSAYYNALFTSRITMNATAYLDGTTAGLIQAMGNIFTDSTSSTQSSPATIGFNNFAAAGRAGRFQFGDTANALQNANSGAMQLYSYHRLELSGGSNSGAPSYFTGTKKGIALNAIQVMVDSRADGIAVLGVQSNSATQTANLQNWYDSAGAILGSFTPTGRLSIGVSAGTSNSTLQISGSLSTAIVTKTAAYTATISDSTILANATTAAFSVTLPTAVGIAGRIYNIKKIDSTANVVTIATTSSQTIDGATTRTLATQYTTVSVQSDGANWYII